MTKKTVHFTTKIGLLSHLPGMHYIEIPAQVIQSLGDGKFNLRLICTLNKKLKLQGGIVALGKGKGYVSITKKKLKELGLNVGDRVEVDARLDSSRFGMKMPEELNELLKQDDEGRRRFEGLTPGKQRYIIHYVGVVKNPDRRIERALLLIENLKRAPAGKETFRQMLGLPARKV